MCINTFVWRHIPIRRCMRFLPLPPTMHHEADHDHRGPSQEGESCRNRPVAKFRNRGRLTPIVASDACTQPTNYPLAMNYEVGVLPRHYAPLNRNDQNAVCLRSSTLHLYSKHAATLSSTVSATEINIRHHYSVLKSDARFPSAVTSMLRID